MADRGTTKFYSNKQEKMVADALGSYPVGGSGAFAGNPGDVRTYDWLVECKTHTSPDHNIIFNHKVWSKIEEEAMGIHRKPVLIVDDGSQSARRTWCLCRKANLNLDGLELVNFIVDPKTNISCKHDKLAQGLKNENSIYNVMWEGQAVVILPLNKFKEVFEA